MTILQGNKRFIENQFSSEDVFEELIRQQSKLLFGKETIFIYTKRKVSAVSLGASIPDGFLFDLTDMENPEFYLVEVELEKHDFYKHIFPQITKFFGFYRNPASQNDLVEKLFSIINTETSLKLEFKKILGDREIYKFLKDIVEDSQNILLIIDGDKAELPEIIDTYSDTWGKLVKVIKVKKYVCGEEYVISAEPDFVDIQFAPETTTDDPEENGSETSRQVYTEDYHLNGVSEFSKNIYLQIKKHINNNYPDVILNPQKYYIGIRKDRNLAFLKIGKKRLRVVVMLPENEVCKVIKSHLIRNLSEGVQRFYNGPCCAVVFQEEKPIDEFWPLLKDLLK